MSTDVPLPAGEPGGTRSDAALLEHALFEVKRVIVGQDRLVERLFVALLS